MAPMKQPADRVSILVRTIGRASLARSVAAALAQLHAPFEIVIVNASGTALPVLPEGAGVAIRIIEATGATRPRAANIALEHARGDWLIFLDDDDSFAPDHVASLLAAAQAAGAQVAYSSTRCLKEDGTEVAVLGAPFNRLHLLAGNYIQIGAALFSAELLARGARFDESLLCLQDWDFWIQVSRFTHFVHTGNATNLWSAYGGSSGAGMGENERPATTAPFKALIAAKWAAHGVSLRGKLRHHRDAAQAAMDSGRLGAAQRHLDAVERLSKGPVTA
jgi:glycosyltransferase involved in cell wall biosynthesis